MVYSGIDGEVEGPLSITLCAQEDEDSATTPFDSEFYGMEEEIQGGKTVFETINNDHVIGPSL